MAEGGIEKPPCPNCGRAMGYQYLAREPGRCHLWRVLNMQHRPDYDTVVDCFNHTTKRLKQMEEAAADLEGTLDAAQSALARRHAKQWGIW